VGRSPDHDDAGIQRGPTVLTARPDAVRAGQESWSLIESSSFHPWVPFRVPGALPPMTWRGCGPLPRCYWYQWGLRRVFHDPEYARNDLWRRRPVVWPRPRSGAVANGNWRSSVKPSAQPTQVRTLHLPHQLEKARHQRKRGDGPFSLCSAVHGRQRRSTGSCVACASAISGPLAEA
jgi:hypothetical protein